MTKQREKVADYIGVPLEFADLSCTEEAVQILAECSRASRWDTRLKELL